MDWNEKMNKNISDIQKNLDTGFSSVYTSSNIPVSRPILNSNVSLSSKQQYKIPSPSVSFRSENLV
jgi:hypothetical protein